MVALSAALKFPREQLKVSPFMCSHVPLDGVSSSNSMLPVLAGPQSIARQDTSISLAST